MTSAKGNFFLYIDPSFKCQEGVKGKHLKCFFKSYKTAIIIWTVFEGALEWYVKCIFQVNLIIIRPTAQAVVSLTFAYYVLQPGFETCDPPKIAVRFLAAICISKYNLVAERRVKSVKS